MPEEVASVLVGLIDGSETMSIARGMGFEGHRADLLRTSQVGQVIDHRLHSFDETLRTPWSSVVPAAALTLTDEQPFLP
jgi:hypothetical protein